MLRELFSSRLILAGLVILFVVAGAYWFYSWHVQRTVDAELAKTDAMLHSRKNDGETRYAQDTVDFRRFEQDIPVRRIGIRTLSWNVK